MSDMVQVPRDLLRRAGVVAWKHFAKTGDPCHGSLGEEIDSALSAPPAVTLDEALDLLETLHNDGWNPDSRLRAFLTRAGRLRKREGGGRAEAEK